MKDIWPDRPVVTGVSGKVITPEMFKKIYSDILKGHKRWQDLDAGSGTLYSWDESSTYIANPPFFSSTEKTPKPV